MNEILDFQKDGYKIFRNQLDELKIKKLQLAFSKTISQNRQEIKGTYFYLAHTLNKTFLDFIEINPVQKYVDQVLSETCIIHSFNGITLKPKRNNDIQNAIHRDTPRFCRPYLLSVQILIMLDDFTKENGATYLMPKSHLMEKKPSKDEFYKNAIQLEGKAGDIVLFDSLCWHAGGNNLTDKERRALTIVYSRSFMKQQIDLTTSISISKIDNVKTRRLLGFNVRVPKNINEFNKPKNKRLYKSNQG